MYMAVKARFQEIQWAKVVACFFDRIRYTFSSKNKKKTDLISLKSFFVILDRTQYKQKICLCYRQKFEV